VTTLPRLGSVLLALSFAACSQPNIEKRGTGGKQGNTGGQSGGGAGGHGGRGSSDGPNFGVEYPDGGPGGSGDPGDGQTCAGDLYEANLVPLDLLLLLDISGSMEEAAGMQSKWAAMHDALDAFIKDPKSNGLGVGLETFPPTSKTCAKDTECGTGGHCEEKGVCSPADAVARTEQACDAAKMKTCDNMESCTKYGICAKSGLRCVGTCPGGDACGPRPKFCVVASSACPPEQYATPIVAVADLPGAQPKLAAAMAGIVPQGTTPTTPAVTGALQYLRTRAMANPTRKEVLVMATDGLPTECTNNSIPAAAAVLGAANMAMPGISTYVIGIFAEAQRDRSKDALGQLATAGGTGEPFILTTGDDLTGQFLAKLNQIRGAELGCEFAIPKPMGNATLDFDQLNVRVSSGGADGGTDENVGYVANAMACDMARGGWYYDADPKTAQPTRVLLCEASCKKVQMKGVKVALQVGCKTVIN
jgi:hypothetical protein